MPENISPDRRSLDNAIQEKQGAIDLLDTRLDSKVDIQGLSPEQKNAMKDAYITKVNLFQGRVRRSFDGIAAQRDLSSPTWRNWESAVLDTERDLYVLLRGAHESMRSPEEGNTIDAGLASFNLSIDELLNTLSRLSEVHESPPVAREEIEGRTNQPHSIEAIFSEWNLPGQQSEIFERADRAREHYPETQIRNLAAGLSFYGSLPESVQTRIFGTSAPINLAQIAGQLGNGTFEHSPLAFLLTDDVDSIENRVLLETEGNRDRLSTLTQNLREAERSTRDWIVNLCRTAGADVPTDNRLVRIWAWAMEQDGYQEIQEQNNKQ